MFVSCLVCHSGNTGFYRVPKKKDKVEHIQGSSPRVARNIVLMENIVLRNERSCVRYVCGLEKRLLVILKLLLF